MTPAYTARRSLVFLCAIAITVFAGFALAEPQAGTPAAKDDDILSQNSVWRDPDTPVLGNPNGNLTVVEFFDYQCPYCRKLAPELAQVVKDDGQIRIVLKDWPIFGDASVLAAKLALAARYQDKYAQAHDALIAADGKLDATRIDDLMTKAGVDVARAKADLETNRKSIEAVLARNNAQAEAFGFEGTPGFIVGTLRVPGVVEMKVFKMIVADARAAAKKKRQ
jgi:protein-disulfide isomerase